MKLKVIKAVWGMPGSWDSQLRQIAEAGYTGVESPMPSAEDEDLFRSLITQYSLDLVLQIYTEGPDHAASFEMQALRAATFEPFLINSHSAKDSMPYDAQLDFFQRSIRLEQNIGVQIAHETHRGRATFTPWSTARLLRDLPDLKIVADFSHWCNVCESMLPDQAANLAIAMRHTVHIHGRVGYEQGPQVPDFRAPEYEYALIQHEKWWTEICELHQTSGRSFVSFTPEFGPPGYMHTQPFTNQPVVDLWEICEAMGDRFREQFTRKFE